MHVRPHVADLQLGNLVATISRDLNSCKVPRLYAES